MLADFYDLLTVLMSIFGKAIETPSRLVGVKRRPNFYPSIHLSGAEEKILPSEAISGPSTLINHAMMSK